jgi:hypothetical protein
MNPAFNQALREAVAEVLAAYPDRVSAWRASQPGAWGFLAGQGVLACRRRLGRSLTDRERRVVWDSLWRALNALPWPHP